MIWWVGGGAVVLGLLLLVAAGWLLSKRARPLRRALRRLEIRAEEAARLRGKVERAQHTLATIRVRAVTKEGGGVGRHTP